MVVGGVEAEEDDDDAEDLEINFSCGKLERRDGRILSTIDFDCFDLVPRVPILIAGVLEVEVFDDMSVGEGGLMMESGGDDGEVWVLKTCDR